MFGRRGTETAPSGSAEVSTPKNESDLSQSAERAGRMRRLARKVIGHVLGEVAAEPARAKAGLDAAPLDTEPLAEAAEDLRGAAQDLDSTLHDAKETLIYERRPNPEFAPSGPDSHEGHISAQISQRIERLEAKVETSSTISLAAMGLGVVAVLVAGHEYFARKRVERTVQKSNRAQKALEEQVKTGQREFVALQKEQATAMDREHRKDYYERLAEFTHHQAASTREVHKELQHSIDAAIPVLFPEPLPPPERQLPTTATPEKVAQPPLPEPLRRVESADTVEQSGQAGNAGTGFFGGGMAGIGGRIQQTLGLRGARNSIQRMSQEEISAETRRQARLASNAWLYSAGFVIAVAALVLSLIFST